jgi:DNA-binding XRE family transcriptional regulator
MEKDLKNSDIEIMEILDTEQQTIYKAEKEKMKEEVKAKRKKK